MDQRPGGLGELVPGRADAVGVVAVHTGQPRQLAVAGRATPGAIVSHEIALEKAPQAHEQFDKRAAGWTKVLLRPSLSVK